MKVQTTERAYDRATELLRAAPVIDGHNDLPWALRQLLGHDPETVVGGIDLTEPHPELHTDLGRLRAGGVGGQFWSVYVPCDLAGDAAVTAVLEQIELVHGLIARYPRHLRLARTAAEVEAAIAGGQVASLLGAEGGHCLAESLGVLRALYRLGVRYLTLTHVKNVSWADSATDEPVAGGLTGFGREVVAEMNRLGMLVDLSHVAPSTMRDALDVSTAPVIFSHSSCRAVHDHPRNVPDDVLARLAGNGGVCMVTFVPVFLTAEPTATVADVVAHIEHAREVAGIDHIGIGGDFDGVANLPDGLEHVGRYPVLFQALLDRGWSAEDCAKLAGRNVLRVLAAAEEIATGERASSGKS
jgi:membrane dipeptidase